MAQQFTGTVEILNSDSSLPTIILEGGDDERGGNCALGGNGQDGDLTLKDTAGRQRIFMNAGQSFARFEDGNNGITIFLDGPRGAITAGASNASGSLRIVDGSGRTVFDFTASNAQLILGGTGNPSNIFIRDTNNKDRVHLDGAAGDIKLFGADCAEEFALVEPVEPGTVLVIDAGVLVPSCMPYDSRVAGVASGAGDLRPGLILGHDRSSGSRTPVALTGRVYCKVDATFGPVRPGDLLTTSSTPGHAMRASDRERAFGSVIGKALEAVAGGQALVPILVSLN